MKQTMKNHIRVEEASTLRYGPPRFFRDNQPIRSPKKGCLPKKDCSFRRDNNPNKGKKKPIKERLIYSEVRIDQLNTTLTKVLAAIHDKEFVCYPSPMKSPPNTCTSKKYCFFFYIKIEDMTPKIVMFFFEMLIAKGYLHQFFKKDSTHNIIEKSLVNLQRLYLRLM